MVQNFKMPVKKIVVYHLNIDSNYYELHAQPPGFNKLPKDLKVEETQVQAIRERGANQIIQGRQKNGKKTFFTGLRPTYDPNIFFGDDGYIRPGNKSFMLFQFSIDSSKLMIYYHPGFMPFKPMREDFIQWYITTAMI